MPRKSDESTWIPVPVPAHAPTAPSRHFELGSPTQSWSYLSADGELLGYVNRYDTREGGKEFRPQTYNGKEWKWITWPAPRPLYGLDLLADRPKAWVVIVEGEKSADAARLMIPNAVVVSAPGGAQALRHADWRVLIGRPGVILWPDDDPPPKKETLDNGPKAFTKLAAYLANLGIEQIKLIDPSGMGADGWDAADSGFTPAAFLAWAKPRTRVYAGPIADPWAEAPPEQRERPAPATRAAVYAEAKPAETPFAEPMNLFSRPALPVLKPEHLPAALRDYVFDQSALIGSDPGIMAIASLVAVAGASHDGYRLQMKQHDGGGFSERPCLWGAWIAGPGARKSPAQSRAVKPMRAVDMAWSKTYAAELVNYRLEEKVHRECESKYVKDRAKSVMGGGSYNSPVAAPKAPQDRRLIADDATIESLALLLAENPRGLTIPADELSGWFASMDAYKGSGVTSLDRSRWLEAYEGGQRRIDRVSRKGDPIIVPNWSLCVMGGIQPDSMRRISDKLPDDGLLQRFMLTMAVDAVDDEDRPYNASAKARYTGMIERLADVTRPCDPFTFSDEARAEFRWLSRETSAVARLSMLSPRMKSHLGKIDGLFGRLAIVHHLADAADRGQSPPPQVAGKTASTVADFIRDYLAGHLRAFYDDLLSDTKHRQHAIWIAGHILAHELDQIENRRLQQNYPAWGSMPKWEREQAMQMLEDSGWVYPIHGDNPARKVVRWEVNPLVHSRFAGVRDKEQVRRRSELDKVRESAMARAAGGAE